jgi:cyclophilin family peptidyl-prolyl cis-trans isomerase
VNYCNNSYYNNLPIGKPINKFQIDVITFEKQRKRKRERKEPNKQNKTNL